MTDNTIKPEQMIEWLTDFFDWDPRYLSRDHDFALAIQEYIEAHEAEQKPSTVSRTLAAVTSGSLIGENSTRASGEATPRVEGLVKPIMKSEVEASSVGIQSPDSSDHGNGD